MRTVYLQKSLSINGRDALGGRRLVDRLRDISEDLLLGHIITAEGRAANMHSDIRKDIISEVELLKLDPNVIFLEHGLFTDKSGSWRFQETLAHEFVAKGGTLIIADVDANQLREQRRAYNDVSGFLGAAASYHDREPVLGYDEKHFWKGTKQILCYPENMVISEWLRPVYNGIPEILCGLPVRLAFWEGLLASGNTNSTWSNATDGIPGPDNLPFASVKKEKQGFVVLICGNVTADVWLERCPYNTAWLVNLAEFLVSESDRERRRGGSALKSEESVFLSHAHSNKKFVAGVHHALTRRQNVGTWLDLQQLTPGDNLPDHIIQAVHASSIFVLFWSRAAAESEWVSRELSLALKKEGRMLVIVRLEDIPVPEQLANLLRIEAIDANEDEVAEQLSKAMQRHKMRMRIDEARKRGETTDKNGEQEEEVAGVAHPSGSLTRPKNELTQDIPKPFTVAGSLQRPDQIATIRSTYRIGILSFLDLNTLVAGSGDFDRTDVENVRKRGFIKNFQKISCQTGMDGHLDDHVLTRRHLLHGYHDMKIVDRSNDNIVATFECDTGANVMSAAWNPSGDRIIVGSTNYLTIADDQGRIISHKNLWEPRQNYFPKSVAWQPSINPVFVSGNNVYVTNPDGHTIDKLVAFDSVAVAVAISPCRRFLAGAAQNGQVAIWSESGELLAMLEGFASDNWHASRCLVFSPDSRLLAQCGCVNSEGFVMLELVTGKTIRVEAPKTNLLAFHPTLPATLLTASADRITFWRTL